MKNNGTVNIIEPVNDNECKLFQFLLQIATDASEVKDAAEIAKEQPMPVPATMINMVF